MNDKKKLESSYLSEFYYLISWKNYSKKKYLFLRLLILLYQ